MSQNERAIVYFMASAGAALCAALISRSTNAFGRSVAVFGVVLLVMIALWILAQDQV